ncbi:hypothetical protein EDD85DRAFT_955916 [Armillaria nabsnona]|nr:hypothetical protein EDD85DRAFT_955916 [Armillaria nabsnona]
MSRRGIIVIFFPLDFVFAGMSRLSPFSPSFKTRFFWDPNPVANDTIRRPWVPSILRMHALQLDLEVLTVPLLEIPSCPDVF